MSQSGHPQARISHISLTRNLDLKGTRVSELARRAGMTKQAMGQIVDDLEQLGYVERIPDPADGRAKIVRFTAVGLDFVCDAAEVLDEIWHEYAERLGVSELERVQEALLELLRGVRRDSPSS